MALTGTILQVTASLDGQGGVQRGTVELAEYIETRGWRSLVASHGGELVNTLKTLNIPHFDLPLHKRTPWHIVANGLRLAKIIREHEVSVVHARSRAPAWAAYLACKLTATPFTTTFHGTHRINFPLKRFYNSIMAKGDRVIAISQFIARHIQDNYPTEADKLSVAPRGYDPRRFSPAGIEQQKVEAIRHEWGLKHNVPVLLLPGRLTRWKGQDYFIKSLALVKDQPWNALLVGGEDSNYAYRKELEDLTAKLGLDGRVKFLGVRRDLPELYTLADVVISASIEPEAFGRVAVEAQAMGTPVVAFNHGGATENVCPEAGFLVTPKDVGALAEGIKQALSTGDTLAEKGKIAQAWVAQHFTTEQMCRKEFDAITSCAKI